MKTKRYIVLLLVLIAGLSYGQSSLEKSANKSFEGLSYVKTAERLLKIAEKGKASTAVLERLGTAYYYNNQMADASKWYGELFSNSPEGLDAETYYRYAMSLKSVGDYKGSNKIMDEFSQLKPNDRRSKLYQSEKDYLSKLLTKADLYELENLGINTEYSDFGTTFYNGGIVFASSRNTQEDIYKWNEQPFLDLFYAKIGSNNIKRLGGSVNTRYHESSTSFSKGGDTLYFTRNNYFQGKVKKSEERVNGLKIFRAIKTGLNSWGKVEELPFNSNDYNTAHPALSPDGKQLYFASDMPGSLGGSDIFVVDINSDGTYSTPRNLGERVNTEGRENFPYISTSNILYFSSDGRLGLGGLDVFKLDLSSSNTHAVNLGKPLNSGQDDFEFIIDEQTGEGYITSNRPGGKGDDDIYRFTKIPCQQKVKGLVVDANTTEVLSKAQVLVYNSEGLVIETLTSDAEGAFSYASDCREGKFKVKASKEGYKEAIERFKKQGVEDVVLKLALSPKPAAKIDEDLAKVLNLNPIYFDFDQSKIRSDAAIELEKVIAYLQKYPKLKIDVRSHTDSRSRDSYNLKLSNRRNQSTIQYLIDHGIASNRITGRGYGETQLVNNCRNGVKCSEAEHQQNRRSEFIVVEN